MKNINTYDIHGVTLLLESKIVILLSQLSTNLDISKLIMIKIRITMLLSKITQLDQLLLTIK